MDLDGVRSRLGDPAGKLADTAFTVKVLAEAGVIGAVRPDKLFRMGVTFKRWGTTPATGIALAAIHHPDRVFIEDESGSLTFAEVHSRTNALARSWSNAGVTSEHGVGIMCRNHRGFVEATLAAAKLGASSLYLNTMFSGPQLADVVEREDPKILVYDEEFTDLLAGVGEEVKRFIAWRDGDAEVPSLEDLIATGDDSELGAPEGTARFVILTSGTTGTPKGAQRSTPRGLGMIASLIDRIPYRSGDRMMIAAPLFHSWGFTHFAFALPLAATLVLKRRFSEQETLEAVHESRATALIAVPVMIQRILALPDQVLDRYRLGDLRVTALSGSALPGDLALEWMDRFGDNLYNLYGSTEIAFATIAGPEDLRAAPGTAGRPPHGTVVKLLDEDGNQVARGQVGRVFVANEMAFEGYTGGGSKQAIDGMLSSGDVGHFDEEGRLFIDGRDDDMIVSGGENVFPREVEDLLAGHGAVDEVAVIGVVDTDFGQRLRAFVVLAVDSDATESHLQKYVKQHLAGFKSPREIVFLEQLPRNATGKILKRELRDHEIEDEP